MTDDIVTRLRETNRVPLCADGLQCEAVDEINRLTDVGRDLARAVIALLEQRPDAKEAAYAAVKRWIGAGDSRRNGSAGAAGTGAQEADRG